MGMLSVIWIRYLFFIRAQRHYGTAVEHYVELYHYHY